MNSSMNAIVVKANDIAHSTVWMAKAIILGSIAIFLWFAADREPPFSIVSVEPAAAKPGEWVTITAHVKRDLRRPCSVEFSRYVFDADGTQYNLIAGATASQQMIRDIERKTPGKLVLSFVVPQTATPGPAEVKTTLDYRCNYTHRYFPIEVTTSMPFTVLGPVPN